MMKISWLSNGSYSLGGSEFWTSVASRLASLLFEAKSGGRSMNKRPLVEGESWRRGQKRKKLWIKDKEGEVLADAAGVEDDRQGGEEALKEGGQ